MEHLAGAHSEAPAKQVRPRPDNGRSDAHGAMLHTKIKGRTLTALLLILLRSSPIGPKGET
jgi:hypothetical protein